MAAFSLSEKYWAIDALEVQLECLDGAVAHGGGHDLVLDLSVDELLAGAGQLDEVDFEGARRYIRHLVREAAELGAVRNDLKHRHVQFVEERGDFRCLSDALGEGGSANDARSGLCEVDRSRITAHLVFDGFRSNSNVA